MKHFEGHTKLLIIEFWIAFHIGGVETRGENNFKKNLLKTFNLSCPMRPSFGCEQFTLTPLTLFHMVFWLYQLLHLFMFKSTVLCHLDNFDPTKLINFEYIEIWECPLSWFIMGLVHKPKLDICHLCGLRASYPKHVLLIPTCKWFSIDLRICMAHKHNIS